MNYLFYSFSLFSRFDLDKKLFLIGLQFSRCNFLSMLNTSALYFLLEVWLNTWSDTGIRYSQQANKSTIIFGGQIKRS